MVRLFPSTTVTFPTGSMVIVWATETASTPMELKNKTLTNYTIDRTYRTEHLKTSSSVEVGLVS